MLRNDINAGHSARPQNLSYPAGGATGTQYGQRGVIVAPPSRNTDKSKPADMTILHRGFDTLTLAVQTNIPAELFDYLDAERERAEQERQDVLIEYNGIHLHLKSHGGHGYRFIASGGPHGATWFFKKPNPKDAWGIRVNFGSTFLALNGLGAAKAHLEMVTAALGIRYGADDISISRADFCVDILAPHFELNPEQFVMHSSAGRRDFVKETDKAVHGRSGRTTSVTVGSSRNRQVIVYDKRAEIIHSGKAHWWEIWNMELRRNGLSEVDPKCADSSRVWRVEFRAGKDLLKDRWNIRTWAQFFDRFGDLCRETGEVVRYTEPNPTDCNRARWPNHLIWELACSEMNGDLMEMRSGCDPNPLKEVHKEQQISMILRNVLGCTVTLAALRGVQYSELPGFFQTTADELTHKSRLHPEKVAKQLEDARNRYVFL